MSSVVKLIEKLTENVDANDDETAQLARDVNYIRKSSSLISDALQKGFDVMQTADGEIVITEVKTVSYRYTWNDERSKFERVTTGNRQERRKIFKKLAEEERAEA